MLYIRHTVNRLKFFLTIGTLVAICLSMFYVMHALTVHAAMQTFSWTTPDSPTFTSLGSAKNYNPDKHCINQVINVDKIPYATNYYVTPDNEVTACVYNQTTKTGSFRYASYSRWYNMWQVGYNDESFVMSFGLDQKMYRVSGLPSGNYAPLYAANFDGFIYHYAPSTSGWGQRLDIFKDIHSKLVKTSSNSYHFDTSSPEFTFKRPNGYILPTGAMATSPNGKWLVFEAVDIGIVRLNLDTLSMKRVSTFAGTHGLGSDPAMSLAINNDGDNVFMGGYYVPFDLVHVTDTCGDMTSVTNTITHDTPIAHPCITKDLNQYVGSHVDRFAAATDFSLSDDGGVFSFTAQSWDRGKEVRASLTAPGYDSSRLEYLVMGDSYSSGEGDFTVNAEENHARFLPHTDDMGYPQEMCHISYSSYPMRLRDSYQISSSLMNSVACSGAKTIDIDKSNSQLIGADDYHGQGDRLQYFPKEKEYQGTALTDFIPGRIEQIKFVEKYKPRVLTIGIGGNDVGFSKVINDCVGKRNDECKEALQDGAERQRLARRINSEFYILRDLYSKLRSASPQTKIYVIGYPQFIADSNSPCLLNAGFANTDERHLINEATHYMNLVIKAAAESAGVQYVDIEHSLNGGEMCQGVFTDYVTGVRNEWWIQALGYHSFDEYLYHPNAAGHEKIAEAVVQAIGDNFLHSENSTSNLSMEPPDYTSYFASARENNLKTLSIGSLDSNVLKQGQETQSSSVQYTYQQNSVVTVTVYSTPQKIGDFTTDETGKLTFHFTVPSNLPTGYHELVFKGLSFSGEPIEYVEDFFVRGNSDNDLDADGIIDSRDKCLFVTPLDADVDHDGVDDGCDDIITPISEDDMGSSVTLNDAAKHGIKQNNTPDTNQVVAYTASNPNTSNSAYVLGSETSNNAKRVSVSGYVANEWLIAKIVVPLGGAAVIMTLLVLRRRIRHG